MKFIERIKIILIAFSILVLLALALPEFSFKFQNRIFTYPSIGFSKINIPEDFPSLTKGYGIFPSEKYKVEISMNEDTEDTSAEFTNILNRVKSRALYANLHDIKIEGVKNNESYFIELTIPEHYDNKDGYAEWLTAPAKMEVLDISGGNQLGIDIYDFTLIRRSLNLAVYRETSSTNLASSGEASTSLQRIGTINSGNLIIDVKESKALSLYVLPTFSESVQNTSEDQLSSNYIMSIDGGIDFYLYIDENNSKQIRALPVSSNTEISSRALNNYLKIVQAYFQEIDSLKFSAEVQSESISVAPEFNNDGGRFIALTFVIIFILLGAFAFRLLGFKKTVIYGLNNMFVLLISLISLKFVFADISIGFILGYAISLVISNLVILSYLSKDKNSIAKYRQVIFIITFILLAINFSGIYLGIYIDVLEVLLSNAIGLIIASFTTLPWTYEMYIKKDYKLTSILRK
jgi:hypothetical protein